MALSPGTRLGHYDVTALIGEGGMGQVWQATDTKLNRQVALKILPDAFADDPDRLARFRREAQVLASLNHPGIASIHGVAEAEGTLALVLELVEGPTLADRIAEGPVPIADALLIAKQIAGALEAAHEAGVIHRDLKPANVKVTPDGAVKVLDFGLAKASNPGPEGDPSLSPTLTAAATQMGVIIGTAAYMAPEQARGKPVDKRADIWAFGAVLFEMLSGRRPFEGDDVTMTLAQVVQSDPDWTVLPDGLAPAVELTLRRCLEKEPRDRLRDIGDVAHALDGRLESPGVAPDGTSAAPAQPAWVKPTQWVAAALLGAAAVAGASGWLRAPAEPPDVVLRFEFSLPPNQALIGASRKNVTVSRDGRRIAFITGDGLWVRALDSLESNLVVEGNVRSPFFSPDGLWIGYWDLGRGQLRKVEVSSGTAATLGGEDSPPGRSAWWSDDDTIFFAAGRDGVRAVPGAGGAVRTLIDDREGFVASVQPLPGGDWVLVTEERGRDNQWRVLVVSLATGEREVVVPQGTSARYLPTGHLVFARDGTLFASRFDPVTREVGGSAIPLVEGVATSADSGVAHFDVADNGSLIYLPGGQLRTGLAWVGRQGEMTTMGAELSAYSDLRLSPDERRLAFHGMDSENDIWTTAFDTGAMTRRTFEAGEDETPAWSPDGRSLVYASERDGMRHLVRLSVDGPDEPETLWQDPRHFHVADWSQDGGSLLLDVQNPETDSDVYALSLDGDLEPRALLETRFNERSARLSPDGHWMAYASDESGRDEVYVVSFPDLRAKRQASTGGGVQPVWARDGSELFFRGPNEVMAVAITAGESLEIGPPIRLFEDRFIRTQNAANHTSYDVAVDGRFLMLASVAGLDQIRVVANWDEELRARVP